MEVHHHSGHEAPAHKKRWTHYVFEFLMLFLAVFAGFLAENKREHLVEEKRAKVYAEGLLNDLKADTMEVQAGLKAERFRQAAMDSIIILSKSRDDHQYVPAKVYYYSRFVSNLYTIDWNSSTLNQLIPSGNLRLFKSTKLIDKINAYYASQGILTRSTLIAQERREKLLEIRSRLLLSKFYAPFGGADFMIEQNLRSPSIDSALLNKQYPLSGRADILFDEYINLLIEGRWYLDLNLKRYPLIIKDAAEIMQLLKEDFHIH